MSAEPLELAGLLVACGGAATALVVRDPRLRSLACFVALAAAPLLVLGDVWAEPRVVEVRESPVRITLALLAGGALLAATVAVLRRWPAVLPVALFALLPLRVPVDIGGETANLLVPLYAVIAAGVIAAALADRAAGWPRGEPGPLGWLRPLLAATLVLYAIQAAYSEDVSNAIENAGFFLVPFAVMAVLLLEVRWTRELLRAVLAAVAAVAALAAAVGLVQSALRELFLNPELFDANQLHAYFRVNSIFYDPNIFGRYLALAITALGASLAWGSHRRSLAAALAVAALCLAALACSYSITSFAALLAGLGILAVLRWGWPGLAAAGALGLAGLVALLLAGGTPTSDIESDRSIDSGRADLVSGGLELAGERPLAGFGSGSFGAAFYERIEAARTTVSHSEPITVAAEQGAVGLAVYLATVAAALLTLFAGGVRASPARAAVAACFVAMLVHSLGYAGFAIDPATWALLGLGIALRGRPDSGG